MMKQGRAEPDHCRHAADSAKEKVERNFPSPDRRFHHRLTVIARFSRGGSSNNVHTATGNHSLLPRFLAPLFKPLFLCRRVYPKEKAKASSVTTSEAVAVGKDH